MRCDFSWTRSAIRYEALYRDAIAAKASSKQPVALEPGK
jgi:hypothetical protein